jgi:hypothetical protein
MAFLCHVCLYYVIQCRSVKKQIAKKVLLVRARRPVVLLRLMLGVVVAVMIVDAARCEAVHP